MFVAVVGCGHGEVDKIYDVVASIEEKRGIKISLVLCCGDFQTVRNMTDLRCMACPIKYQQMHDFHRYYSGEKVAPVLTLFVGGNHEASNYLQELPYGGWVAPNMYFMGYSGVVRFGHIRIAGISGIYKGHDYLKGRYECPPYTQDTMRSVYHYRNLDTFRLKQIKKPIDIVLSHDWPVGMQNFGNVNQLLRKKPFFRDEIERDSLGSRPLFDLLVGIQPTYWFSAHMHVKFGAIVQHERKNATSETPDSEAEACALPKSTKFLALDKALPGRQFLQVIELNDEGNGETEGSYDFSYDADWLAILRSTDSLISTTRGNCFMPGPGYSSRSDFSPTEVELQEIEKILGKDFSIPENFVRTAPIYFSGDRPTQAIAQINPQTKELCDKLGITDPISLLHAGSFGILGGESVRDSFEHPTQVTSTYESSLSNIPVNPDEISLDDEESEGADILPNSKVQSLGTAASEHQAPARTKLVLPPPRDPITSSVEGNEFANQEGDRSDLLQELFNTPQTNDLQQLSEAGHSFMIDKVGEPEVKKRRNAAFYDLNS